MLTSKRIRLSLTKQRKLALLSQNVESSSPTKREQKTPSEPDCFLDSFKDRVQSYENLALQETENTLSIPNKLCAGKKAEKVNCDQTDSEFKICLDIRFENGAVPESENGKEAQGIVGNWEDKNLCIAALGLLNIGNTCFMNAILQILRFTPGFLYFIHYLSEAITKTHTDEGLFNLDSCQKVAHDLHKLYKHMRNVEMQECLTSIKNDRTMRKCLEGLLEVMRSAFSVGQQCDAHEFFLWLLKSLKNASATLPLKDMKDSVIKTPGKVKRRKKRAYTSWTRRKRRSSSSPKAAELVATDKNCTKTVSCCQLSDNIVMPQYIGKMFEGDIKYSLCCLECETVKEQVGRYTDLEVPLGQLSDSNEEVGSSAEFLGHLKHSSVLQGDNKYFCDTCVHLTEARQIMEIMSIPVILIFRTRFSMSNKILQDKDYKHIVIPTSLPYFAESCSNVEQERTFTLYAVVVHVGTSLTSGHYLSLIKVSACQDAMCYCDDSGKVYIANSSKANRSPRKNSIPNHKTNSVTKDQCNVLAREGNVGCKMCYGCCRSLHKMPDVSSTDWLCFDDDKVTVMSNSEVSTFCSDGTLGRIKAATPYLLLYR